MTWTRFAASAGLLAALALAPSIAVAEDMSAVQRLSYERSLLELLAKARAERVMAEVEVVFLEEQLAGDGWAQLVFQVEDPLVAELVDTWMEIRIEELKLRGRYGDEHPEMVAARARQEVVRDAVRRELASVVEVRRLGLELARMKEDKFTAALEESGSGVDDAAMAPAFEVMVVQLQTLELEARVEAEHHERLLAEGHVEQVARSVGRGGLVVLLLARMQAQLEDAELALKYGDKHPDRAELAERLGQLDTLLEDQAAQSVAASRLRVDLLQRQIEAMEGLSGSAGPEETP